MASGGIGSDAGSGAYEMDEYTNNLFTYFVIIALAGIGVFTIGPIIFMVLGFGNCYARLWNFYNTPARQEARENREEDRRAHKVFSSF